METVENLAQENHHLRTENDHLKGTRKTTIMKMLLSFIVLFLFALYVITWGSEKQIYGQYLNDTQGDTLVVNIALDGEPVQSTRLEGKTVGSYGNINFNIQFDPDERKVIEDIWNEDDVPDNSESFTEKDNGNDETNFGADFFKRLYGMKEDTILPVKKHQNNGTGLDQRVLNILDEIHEEVMILEDTRELARDTDNLVLEEQEIRQIFKDMYQNVKNIAAACRNLKETSYFIEIDPKIYVPLEKEMMKVVSCTELTNKRYIQQSYSEAVDELRKCDFLIVTHQFVNLVTDFVKVGDMAHFVMPNITKSRNYDESAKIGIETARFAILMEIQKKAVGIVPKIKESFHLLKKVESTIKKAVQCLKPAILEDMKNDQAQWIIEDVKETFEAYAAVFKINEINVKKEI